MVIIITNKQQIGHLIGRYPVEEIVQFEICGKWDNLECLLFTLNCYENLPTDTGASVRLITD